MTGIDGSPLGQQVDYPDDIDARLLFRIPRAQQRMAVGLEEGVLPFHGEDRWTAYELSWLDPHGKPRVAVARFCIPADSPAIVESKSLKLYLNGFAMSRFTDTEAVRQRIESDLTACCGMQSGVELAAGREMDGLSLHPLAGECIDESDVEPVFYGPPDPALLRIASDGSVEETLFTRLFRSNCPVTGQPDWADVQVRYRGQSIDRVALLRYFISYRTHCDFHEQCVERIFVDIKRACAPAALMIHARFTRRGGLDINPWRSDEPAYRPSGLERTARQ